jgi:enamine deaminase RidA (YjgF/YER057c/UK114 family)
MDNPDLDLPREGYHYTVVEAGGRTRVGSGTPWEERVSYSRAVRVGQAVWVSGTTATGPDGTLVGAGDAYRQTHQVLANIARALAQVGARLEDIVRLRIYVVNHADWPAVGAALGETFGAIRPANALVGVAWLVDPAMLVEIEADAVITAN